MTPEARAAKTLILLSCYTLHGVHDKERCPKCCAERKVVEAIKTAVAEERHRCADIAWKMQMESFGGGTAIGNAISDPEHKVQR